MKYALYYLYIQLRQLPLIVAGWFLVAIMALLERQTYDIVQNRVHWADKWMWLWDNAIDGIDGPDGPPTVRHIWYWSAWRNPVNNYRFVKGVARPGWPLFYRTWKMFGKQFYVKYGWMPHEGYPACSCGSGRGY